MSTTPPPYASLMPVVLLLEEHGNVQLDGGFLNSPSGWYCRMRDPIDVNLVEGALALPSEWVVSHGNDTILDRTTWCAILGPGAEVLSH